MPVAEPGDPDRVLEPPLWEQLAAKSAELPQGERLQKVLAVRGWGSRRVCEDMISDGRVTVNGATAVLGRRVDTDHDLVEVDGVPIGVKPGLVYYLLNKPEGVVTTAHDPQGRRTVVQIVPAEPRVPGGAARCGHRRAAAAHQRRRPGPPLGTPQPRRGEGVPGRGRRSPGRGALRRLRDGVELDDGITAPAKVSQPSPGVLRITIHEGRNRQVRRMCEAVGHPVHRLVRVRIGPLRDAQLKPGEWRELSQAEVRSLVESAAGDTRPIR